MCQIYNIFFHIFHSRGLIPYAKFNLNELNKFWSFLIAYICNACKVKCKTHQREREGKYARGEWRDDARGNFVSLLIKIYFQVLLVVKKALESYTIFIVYNLSVSKNIYNRLIYYIND